MGQNANDEQPSPLIGPTAELQHDAAAACGGRIGLSNDNLAYHDHLSQAPVVRLGSVAQTYGREEHCSCLAKLQVDVTGKLVKIASIV
jgi:hypothetical protein